MAYTIKKFKVEKTRPNNTTAYVAQDAVSEDASAGTVWTFAQMRSGAGHIVAARLFTDSEITARHIMHLYSSTPTNAETNDGAQFGILYENEDYKIGEIQFDALSTEDATVGDGSRSNKTGLDIPISSAAPGGTNDVYGILEVLDAYTPAANVNFSVEISVGYEG